MIAISQLTVVLGAVIAISQLMVVLDAVIILAAGAITAILVKVQREGLPAGDAVAHVGWADRAGD